MTLAIVTALLLTSVYATPASATGTTIVSLAGDEDGFGYGDPTATPPCAFYDLHETDDPGAMDSEIGGSETESWTHDFTTDPAFDASRTIDQVEIEIREIFSDGGGAISFDGATQQPFTVSGASGCGPPVVQLFTFSGGSTAFAADGIIDLVLNESGDDIAIDWSRVTVTYGAAVEVCDGIDNDEDGLVDEGLTTSTSYADTDGDTYGDASAETVACATPAGNVSDNTDADDTDATVYPGAHELCDGKDNDQNLTVDDGFTDADADGAADCVDADDDGDGIVDEQDPDVVAAAVAGLSSGSFAGGGHRTATLDRLNKAEALIAAGDVADARAELVALRKRVDGCNGTANEKPDKNDWIVDCEDQHVVRDLIDGVLGALPA